MAKSRGLRIFLMRDDILFDFMWARTKPDGSMYMGICGNSFIQKVEKIFDENNEFLPGKDFELVDSDVVTDYMKISFHPSGLYKMNPRIKKINTDRVTVRNKAFKDIKKPERMLEILLPVDLRQTSKTPNVEKDLILDISSFPVKPLRCTVSCMPISDCDNFFKGKIVSTSTNESTHMLLFSDMAWAWTARISKYDNLPHEKIFYVFLLGQIVMPSIIKRVSHGIKSFFRKIF